MIASKNVMTVSCEPSHFDYVPSEESFNHNIRYSPQDGWQIAVLCAEEAGPAANLIMKAPTYDAALKIVKLLKQFKIKAGFKDDCDFLHHPELANQALVGLYLDNDVTE